MKVSREEVEWLNYWIQDADDRDKKRILLLGDSVARGYRRILNTVLHYENIAVDLLATSYSILDDSLLEELKHFIETIGYQYQSIVFQMGFHHGYWIKCKEKKEDYDAYYEHLEILIKLLRTLNCNMLMLSATPENTCYIDANNEELEIRSDILKRVAEKYGCAFLDLYNILFENKEFAMIDIVHYADNGYEYIAYLIGRALGFQCEGIESNRVYNINSLVEILEETHYVYIYGDGKRGKALNDYLFLTDILAEERYIVSEEFYQEGNKKQILLSDIKDNLDRDDIVLMTIEDYRLWKKLRKMGIGYYTLSDAVYIFIDGYTNGFRRS